MIIVDIIKYIVIIIVIGTLIVYTWKATTGIIKKFKGKFNKTDDIDFQEDLYG